MTDRAQPKQLHSVRDVYAMLGMDEKKGELSQADFLQIVKDSGCYRAIGPVIRMTDSDIDAFLRWSSPKAQPGGEPSEIEVGQIVVIGDPLERDGIVYVNFTERGDELEELERVQVGFPERCMILAVWSAAYGEYKSLTTQWREAKWQYGKGTRKWFRAQVREDLKERIELADEYETAN